MRLSNYRFLDLQFTDSWNSWTVVCKSFHHITDSHKHTEREISIGREWARQSTVNSMNSVTLRIPD